MLQLLPPETLPNIPTDVTLSVPIVRFTRNGSRNSRFQYTACRTKKGIEAKNRIARGDGIFSARSIVCSPGASPLRLRDTSRPAPEGQLVIAMPEANPVSPLPVFLSSFADEYPATSVYLVKPSGVLLTASAPNLKVIDGSRHEIPLRDDFADTLFVLGVPKGVPERKTIAECARVVNDGGQVILKIPNVMTTDRGSNGPSFFEFVARTYYDVIEQDRAVRVEDVRARLSSCFAEVRDTVWGGSTYLYARNRRPHAARPDR